MISHDLGVILVHVPFSGSDLLEENYLLNKNEEFISSFDTKKLPRKKILEKSELAHTIRTFYDYDLFAIVKSPYQRAFEIWKHHAYKLKKSKSSKQTIGEFYENILNGWTSSEDVSINTQTKFLKTINDTYFNATDINFEVTNLFHYEALLKNDLSEINTFFKHQEMPLLSFYADSGIKKDWRDSLDDHAVEVINYIFDEDFDYCGYGKI